MTVKMGTSLSRNKKMKKAVSTTKRRAAINKKGLAALPRKEHPLQVLAILAGIIIFFIVAGFIIDLQGGIKGIWYNHAPLPNFSEGEAYVKRQEFNARVNQINEYLESVTAKAYDFPYIDRCERSDNGWKVKSNFLASCERRVSRLYLTDTPICDVHSRLKSASLDFRFGVDQACTDSTDMLYELSHDFENGYYNIKIQKRVKRVEIDSIGFLGGLYSGESCKYVAYCQYFEGNYNDWPSLIRSESYKTVIEFEASSRYYKK